MVRGRAAAHVRFRSSKTSSEVGSCSRLTHFTNYAFDPVTWYPGFHGDLCELKFRLKASASRYSPAGAAPDSAATSHEHHPIARSFRPNIIRPELYPTMDNQRPQKLIEELVTGFEALQEEYQKLFGQHESLERKLATAREQVSLRREQQFSSKPFTR